MTKIFLTPINSRFKRLINDFGADWVAIGEPMPMHCFGGQKGITAFSLNKPEKVSNFPISLISLEKQKA